MQTIHLGLKCPLKKIECEASGDLNRFWGSSCSMDLGGPKDLFPQGKYDLGQAPPGNSGI